HFGRAASESLGGRTPTGRERTGAGAAALRRGRRQRPGSNGRADATGARPGQSRGGAVQLQPGAHRSGAGDGDRAQDDSMKKKILIPVIGLIGLGVAGAVIFHNSNRPDPNRIVVSGNIELTEVNIAFKTAGRLIERTVDEGDAVHPGQIIARLDRDQLLKQREQGQAGLASARAQLAQAETGLSWQRETLSADLAQRRADLQAVEAKLAELKNGSRPQEIQEAKAAVDNAAAELERARRDWDRAQVLHKNDDISTSQFDQYRNRFDSAQAQLKQTRERYN